MYAVDQTPTGNAVVTVGTGPIVDLLDVIASLRRDGITMIQVRPAGDDHRDRAERVDRLLYDCGFDVADLVEAPRDG